MIGEVIRDRQEFGVVLANEKGIVNTGCTATVDQVLRQYPDGRMDILTRGRRRFEIVLLNDERSYLRGTVEFFDDEKFEPSSPEIQQTGHRRDTTNCRPWPRTGRSKPRSRRIRS